MTITIPKSLPVLSAGKRPPGSGEVCSEQAVNWLVSGRADLGDETDHPSCVQPVLNTLAIAVNDLLPDARRHEMWPVILRQPGTARPDLEPGLSVQLAAWCAEQVADIWDARAAAAYAYAYATAAYAVADATGAAAYAVVAATGAAAYAANDRLLALISGAQSECERLIGGVTCNIDLSRIERLGELVGVVEVSDPIELKERGEYAI